MTDIIKEVKRFVTADGTEHLSNISSHAAV